MMPISINTQVHAGAEVVIPYAVNADLTLGGYPVSADDISIQTVPLIQGEKPMYDLDLSVLKVATTMETKDHSGP